MYSTYLSLTFVKAMPIFDLKPVNIAEMLVVCQNDQPARELRLLFVPPMVEWASLLLFVLLECGRIHRQPSVKG